MRMYKIGFAVAVLSFTAAMSFIVAVVISAPKGYFSW